MIMIMQMQMQMRMSSGWRSCGGVCERYDGASGSAIKGVKLLRTARSSSSSSPSSSSSSFMAMSVGYDQRLALWSLSPSAVSASQCRKGDDDDKAGGDGVDESKAKRFRVVHHTEHDHDGVGPSAVCMGEVKRLRRRQWQRQSLWASDIDDDVDVGDDDNDGDAVVSANDAAQRLQWRDCAMVNVSDVCALDVDCSYDDDDDGDDDNGDGMMTKGTAVVCGEGFQLFSIISSPAE